MQAHRRAVLGAISGLFSIAGAVLMDVKAVSDGAAKSEGLDTRSLAEIVAKAL